MDVLLQPPEQTRSRRGRAEVVNELLWVAAKRTFTSPGPWPLNLVARSLLPPDLRLHTRTRAVHRRRSARPIGPHRYRHTCICPREESMRIVKSKE